MTIIVAPLTDTSRGCSEVPGNPCKLNSRLCALELSPMSASAAGFPWFWSLA
ncbi:MAG: hypothetical protein BJ554DRAFT_7416 [Olpidium bornovanus]|uniref:Uncharacterized protein n=1 Tax=Olpidium bornovanus TaxID=278681 RepID=A0A8H7ZW98_9FUNG|nr:MAG: hypothetical protein BJ554DRAFT_7416 [Olpidium bornovanus]